MILGLMASARSCNVRQPLSVNSVPFCRRILKPLADAVKALCVSSQQSVAGHHRDNGADTWKL